MINANGTWSQAIVSAYLGDPAEEAEEEDEFFEEDEDFGDGGIIIID